MRNPSIKKLPPAKLHENGDVTLYLPLPARSVSPNAQRGQSKFAAIQKSQAVKMHRLIAKIAMENAIHEHGLAGAAFVGYALAFYFRTAAFRDDDNADASCKAYRDGIATALRMNDRELRKIVLSTHAKDAELPRVEMTLMRNAELCQPCPPLTPPRQETADGQGLA